MSIAEAIQAVGAFQGLSLTKSLSTIEASLVGLGTDDLRTFCWDHKIDHAFMASAASVKQIAGQINVIIHAAGILCSLPSILSPDEVVRKISLGAGNTGCKFDLETNFRIAEYKFIDWQGGPETIRQNAVFKDFFELAEYVTDKKKFLYVVGIEHPLKFLRGGRKLRSVLSRLPDILGRLSAKYGENVIKVRDYYNLKKDEVTICDVSPFIGRNVANEDEGSGFQS